MAQATPGHSAADPPPFTVGIEEEYLLIDLETRAVAIDPPEEIFEACRKQFDGMVSHEFLRSQIEVNTGVHETVRDAIDELADLRRCVVETAEHFGLAPMAASTHPFSHWETQHHTHAERYDTIAEDIQIPVRRLMICGMHVHVGVGEGNDELRIDLMNQARYFLPHCLAVTTSSPFWKGEDTGLASYRLSVFKEMPRTGLPNHFESYVEYKRHVDALVGAGVIEDASKLWWDVRPSARYPTLEMRIADVCPKIDDTGAAAALFQCILRMLYRLKLNNQRWRIYASMLVEENRWRAQRYGLTEGLVDFGRGKIIAFDGLLAELRAMIHEDAAALGCLDEIEHLSTIVTTGTSADRQRAVYSKAIEDGFSGEDALKAVVDQLVTETSLPPVREQISSA